MSNKRVAVNVRDDGITVLQEGSGPEDKRVDIVFVHGFQGHPRKTWTYEDEIYWPADFLSTEFPNARIMTFGYDSKMFRLGGANQLGIDGHAKALLNSLERERTANASRPVIYIVHSLGGIVLKEAFRYTTGAGSRHKELARLAGSTRGIIFLGTPHRGGNGKYVFLGNTARKTFKLFGFGTNKKNLENLEVESSTLDQLNEEFVAWCDVYTHVQISSIQETKGLGGWGFTGQVVKNYSSKIGISRERLYSINGNHMEICRFAEKDHPGYRTVTGILERYGQASESTVLDPEGV